jgi:hypothetical protein
MAAARRETIEDRGRITRDDIESKLREISGEVADVGNATKGYVIAAGIVAASAVVAGAYLLGRRKGRRRSTVVEVRRL